MQIKTAFAIGSGILIGIFGGMCIDEDRKIKAINCIKKKIIYALTADEWEPKVKQAKPRYTSYANYNKTCDKPDQSCESEEVVASLLKFNTLDEANEVLKIMKEYDYPTLSVHDAATMRGKNVSYAWDTCGWTKAQIQNAYTERALDGTVRICLPKPVLLT